MARVRALSDDQFHHLLKIAAGLLTQTDGDLREALSQALGLHYSLLQTIREDAIRADVGPGDAILFVPEEGGMAMRVERHAPIPALEDTASEDETEESHYPEIDLLGFQVIETDTVHQTTPRLDAGVLNEDDWEEGPL